MNLLSIEMGRNNFYEHNILKRSSFSIALVVVVAVIDFDVVPKTFLPFEMSAEQAQRGLKL